MRLHPVTNRIAHGLAGDGVGVDNRQIKPGGGANGNGEWWGDRLIYAGSGFLRSCLPDGSDDQFVTDVNGQMVAATFVRASAFGWIAFHWDDNNPTTNGITSSWGLRDKRAFLIDMSKTDGSVLIGNGYQVGGLGVSGYRSGELTPAWTVTSAVPEIWLPYPQGAILDINRACWTEAVNGQRVLKGRGLPPGPALPWNVLHPMSLFEFDGEVWVGYLRGNDDTPLAHPWDYQGVGVCEQGDEPHYGPIAAVVNGKVTLFWSIGPGERAGEIRSDAPAIATIPPVRLDVVAPNVESFQFAGTWVADDSAPGNLALGSRTYKVPRHTAIVAWAPEIDAIPEERRAGLLVYLEGNDSDAKVREIIASNIPIARALGLPMWIYDDRAKGRFALIKEVCGDAPWVWMPQQYLAIGEDPTAFARRVIADARECGGHPYVPVIRSYTSLNKPTQDPSTWFDAIPEAAVIAAMNALVTEGALKLPGFLGPLFFAWDRADGAKQRPAIKRALETAWLKTPTTVTDARAWAAEFCGGGSTQPAPLAITIIDYTQVGTAPMAVIVDCRTNATPGSSIAVFVDGRFVTNTFVTGGQLPERLTFDLTEPGEYRLKATVMDGDRKAETGAVRIIRVMPATKPEIPGITYPSQPGSGTAEGARKPSQEAADAARKEESDEERS